MPIMNCLKCQGCSNTDELANIMMVPTCSNRGVFLRIDHTIPMRCLVPQKAWYHVLLFTYPSQSGKARINSSVLAALAATRMLSSWVFFSSKKRRIVCNYFISGRYTLRGRIYARISN